MNIIRVSLDNNAERDTMNNLLTGLLTADGANTLGIMFLILFMYLIFVLGMYLYTSFAFMAIAKKTNTEPAWLAWIPIANLALLAKIAKRHWWPILLIIPGMIFYLGGIILLATGLKIIGIIFLIIYALIILAFGVFITLCYWDTFKALNKPGWWSLIAIISSIIGMITMLFESNWAILISVIISLGGTIVFLILLGIAAWSNSPSHKIETKTIKQNKKK